MCTSRWEYSARISITLGGSSTPATDNTSAFYNPTKQRVIQFLLDGELEDEDDDNDVSWEGHDSSTEEEDDDESTEEDSTVGSFLRAGSSNEDNDEGDGGDPDDGVDGDVGFTSDDGARDDGSDGGNGDDDGDVGVVPPIKRRKFSGTYWW
jgi:hypothetical protein